MPKRHFDTALAPSQISQPAHQPATPDAQHARSPQDCSPASASVPSHAGDLSVHTGAALIQMQRAYGNRYVQQVLGSGRSAPTVQAKMVLGPPGDHFEREADRIARQVASQPARPGAAPQPAHGDASARQRPDIQRLGGAEGGTVDVGLQQSIEQARAGGQTLPDTVRSSMGQVFGADFGGVRIHTDTKADQLNRTLQARAFTTGQDIFFRQGAYAPGSRSGQVLLAHELTHVVQQGASVAGEGGGDVIQRMTITLKIDDEDTELDTEDKDDRNEIERVLGALDPEEAWKIFRTARLAAPKEEDVYAQPGAKEIAAFLQKRRSPTYTRSNPHTTTYSTSVSPSGPGTRTTAYLSSSHSSRVSTETTTSTSEDADRDRRSKEREERRQRQAARERTDTLTSVPQASDRKALPSSGSRLTTTANGPESSVSGHGTPKLSSTTSSTSNNDEVAKQAEQIVYIKSPAMYQRWLDKTKEIREKQNPTPSERNLLTLLRIKGEELRQGFLDYSSVQKTVAEYSASKYYSATTMVYGSVGVVPMYLNTAYPGIDFPISKPIDEAVELYLARNFEAKKDMFNYVINQRVFIRDGDDLHVYNFTIRKLAPDSKVDVNLKSKERLTDDRENQDEIPSSKELAKLGIILSHEKVSYERFDGTQKRTMQYAPDVIAWKPKDLLLLEEAIKLIPKQDLEIVRKVHFVRVKVCSSADAVGEYIPTNPPIILISDMVAKKLEGTFTRSGKDLKNTYAVRTIVHEIGHAISLEEWRKQLYTGTDEERFEKYMAQKDQEPMKTVGNWLDEHKYLTSYIRKSWLNERDDINTQTLLRAELIAEAYALWVTEPAFLEHNFPEIYLWFKKEGYRASTQ